MVSRSSPAVVSLVSLAFVATVCGAVACSSDDTPASTSGTSGTSGASGTSSGTSGTSAGVAGTAGTAAAGGTAGTAGATAGSAGEAGTAGTGGTSAGAGGTSGGSGSAGSTSGSSGTEGSGGSGGTTAGSAGTGGSAGASAMSNIKHVVLIVQENHTFDNYFGSYCTAPAGSSPTCVDGPSCCEAAPATEPTGISPTVLDDTSNAARDPNHKQDCELDEIHGGLMDRFAAGSSVSGCSNAKNFAVSDDSTVGYYRTLAANNALADRYFQPIAGQSSANDMYFAVAKFVFADNGAEPDAIGKTCSFISNVSTYPGPTIADLLIANGESFGVYAGGYDTMAAAVANNGCPPAPSECGIHWKFYPCVFDPSDIPFAYYPSLADNPLYMHDLSKLSTDVSAGTLPAFSFVKAIGYHSEHPGYGDTLSAGVASTQAIVDQILAGPQADDTLVLITWDEGGGFFDHVPPPPASAVDGKAYGTRVPLLAAGRFARKNVVSHVTMEHSSIVKFLELNFLGTTGQLAARDEVVANIGSLLDATKTGLTIPEN